MSFVRMAAVVVLASFVALAQAKTRAEAGALNDAQIAGVVVATNQVNIDAGKLARTRSTNKNVQRFADQMIKEHTAVNQRAATLAKKLNVTPQDTETSRRLKTAGRERQEQLKAIQGADFDRAYIDHEIAHHEQVLEAFDKVLIPATRSTQLKELLQRVRPAVEEHLEHAKMLQATLD
jgi:putative membrane protein